jgi:hypothetical protein
VRNRTVLAHRRTNNARPGQGFFYAPPAPLAAEAAGRMTTSAGGVIRRGQLGNEVGGGLNGALSGGFFFNIAAQ